MGTRGSLLVLLAALLLVVTPALGDPGEEKQRVDSRIRELREQVAQADRRSGILTSEIAALTAQVRAIEADVQAEQARLASVEAELALRQDRLERLTERFREQTRRLGVLRREHAVAVERLLERVRAIYMGDRPDALSFLLGATSFAQLVDHVEYLNEIGEQDRRIARRVAQARASMARTRAATKRTRNGVARETRVLAVRATEQRAVRDRLVASRDALSSARGERERTLASLEEDLEHDLHEVETLEAQSEALAAEIRAAQEAAAAAAAAAAARASSASPGSVVSLAASSGAGVSAAGFIWPVQGALVSGFGMRGGRMHEGIDITCATGTPVRAVAAGTVIWAGWRGGYGNLVVVDHGNGLSTAYAHNSGYASSVGQQVAQGQVIAYAGSTGNSSGPHVHFEVRVNGSAVDPLGYL
jgi:murein DD-endopeptidase MepM/ murein hydrolase activator NlpD